MKIIKIILLIATFSLLNTNAFGEESKKKDCSKYSAGDICKAGDVVVFHKRAVNARAISKFLSVRKPA